MEDAPRRILFINVSRIGDTLLVTPAVRAVAAYWPQATVDLLAHPKREEVLRHLPFVGKTGAITKHRALLMGRRIGHAPRPYQLVFVCNFDRALIDYALRVADKVVAFRQPDEALNARLYRVVDHPTGRSEHAVDIQLRLPAALGIAPAGKALAYVVTPPEIDWARQFLVAHKINVHRPLLGLQVASFPTKAWRDWPIESFVELCKRIKAAWPNVHFLVFGGELEQLRTRVLEAELGDSATVCAGKLSLRETASLMNQLDLYIGVDTGPTHIMGALHRPMIAMYHSHSSSRLYGPLDHPCAMLIDHPRRAEESSLDVPMAEISVERVWQAVQAALAGRAPR